MWEENSFASKETFFLLKIFALTNDANKTDDFCLCQSRRAQVTTRSFQNTRLAKPVQLRGSSNFQKQSKQLGQSLSIDKSDFNKKHFKNVQSGNLFNVANLGPKTQIFWGLREKCIYTLLFSCLGVCHYFTADYYPWCLEHFSLLMQLDLSLTLLSALDQPASCRINKKNFFSHKNETCSCLENFRRDNWLGQDGHYTWKGKNKARNLTTFFSPSSSWLTLCSLAGLDSSDSQWCFAGWLEKKLKICTLSAVVDQLHFSHYMSKGCST